MQLGTLDFNAIPAPILRALESNSYSRGDSEFSVTQLLGPPQRTWLAQNHEGLPGSPYSSFMALLGTAVHSIFEDHVDPYSGETAEERLFLDIEGVKISGQFDFHTRINGGRLTDYKVTAGANDDVKQAHYDQAQMNGYLAEEHGMPIVDLCVCYIQRDWSESKASREPNYRKTPIHPFVFGYRRDYAIERFHETVRDHREAKAGNPRPCTLDEQWGKPDQWAAIKPKNVRARKLYDTEEEAKASLKADEVVEHRPSVKTFCESYCGYRHVCPQFARETGILL